MATTDMGRVIAGAVVVLLSSLGAVRAADAQNLTLTITTTGSNPGVVGTIPLGQLCGPVGGGTCQFTGIPSGTELRLVANSPSTPGVFAAVGGSAAGCGLGTSTCTFVITEDSAVTLAFNAGTFPSVTINLTGAPGEVGVGNNRCQNVDPGFPSCTTYYGSGSEVRLEARPPQATSFGGFLNGTGSAAACAGTPCTFTLTESVSIDAKFMPCKVTPSVFGGSLSLNVDLGTVEPARWNIWVSVQNTMVPLLSTAIPVVDPFVRFSLPIGTVPPLGTIGVLTTLVDAADGITCSSWSTVNTGVVAPAAGK